ncbi:MAG: leucine--tRNA ligase [Candidatus Levybacteria bacterium]|nr:leucine--tRNA ligase [Candidatus Levybacteria bacterium]
MIESKWQSIWKKEKIYSPNLDKAKKPFYNLMMFPYPSAEGMHVGNMYAFTGADVYGRFQRMQGKDVFEPIGLDGFGIHSENYAIKTDKHPAKQAEISEKNFYRQLKSIGNGFDWSRTVETYDTSYYKWTQWLFIQLFRAGLAYRKKAPVNFCPSCKTVLADEQVLDTRCERCNSLVEKRDLEQWFFAITKYADPLLANIDKLDWSEKVKIAQRQWIGRSEGTLIRFKIKDLRIKNEIEVFTTRADTLYGATFIVLAPEHPVSAAIKDSKIRAYIEKAKEIQKSLEKDKEKTGVFTGLYAINPLNGEEIPVWIADYALMDFGTGALFGDAHDERDVKFAKKYKIPLTPTLITGDKEFDKKILSLEECFTGYGTLIDSGPFTGLDSKQAMKRVAEWLKKHNAGDFEATYHLRDWLISRQRYWGPPIPMVYCKNCADQKLSWFSMAEENEHKVSSSKHKVLSKDENILDTKYLIHNTDMVGWWPVPEKDLPVELPFIKDYKPLGIHSASSGQAVKAPLASHPEFYRTKCPKCGMNARRETDVSDTFLDSAWYFLRYVSTEFDSVPFDEARVKKWLPVNMYIGGAEHSVLHLLYSRFITMVLKDLGFIDFEEPFARFRAHGLIVKDGAKMSKSRGNVVVPDQYVKKFGADSLRTYLMFMGPFSQGGDFRDTGIEGTHRFLRRVWALAQKSISNSKLLISNEGKRAVNKTIKKVTEDVSNLSYNTAIAGLMEYYNFLSVQKEVSKEEIEVFLKLISPFAPHIAEELWSILGNKTSIHKSQWPTYDEKYLVSDEVIIAVQINGKLREVLKIKNEKLKMKNDIEQLAKESAKIKKYLEGKQIKKVIYVEGKIINFVIV